MKLQNKFNNYIGKVYNIDKNIQKSKNNVHKKKPSDEILYSSLTQIDDKMNQFRTEYQLSLNQSNKLHIIKKRQAVNLKSTDASMLATSIQAFLCAQKQFNHNTSHKKSSQFDNQQSIISERQQNQSKQHREKKLVNIQNTSYSKDKEYNCYSSRSLLKSPKNDIMHSHSYTSRVNDRSSTLIQNSFFGSPKTQVQITSKVQINRPSTSMNRSQQKLNQTYQQVQQSNILQNQQQVEENTRKFSDYLIKTKQQQDEVIQKTSNFKDNSSNQQSPQNKNRSISLQDNNEDCNEQSLTQLFGNQLISSLLQSLVINQINKIFGIQYNVQTGVSISQQIINLFDVDIKTLKTFKSFSERQDYLIKKMEEKIDQLLEQQERRSYERQNILNEQTYKYELQNENKNRQNQDNFQWLKLKSKYDAFKKKLKTIMIEKISLYQNQVQIVELIEKEMQNSQKQKKNQNESNNEPIQKENKKTHGREKIDNLNQLNIIDARSIIHKLNAIQDFSYKNGDRNHQIKYFSNIKMLADIQKDKKLCLQTQSYANQFQNYLNGGWDEEKEKLYQACKTQAVQKYLNTSFDISNVNQLMLQPFVQQIQKSIPQQFNREELIEQYRSGVNLKKEEYEFIASTSKLLNLCIDKQFTQKAVDLLSGNIVDYLERDLAEDIIMKHEIIVDNLKRFRNDYFKAKNNVLQKKFKEQKKQQMEKEMNQKRQIEQKKFLRIVKNRLTKLIDQNPIKQASYKNFFIILFAHKLKQRLQYAKTHKKVYASRFNPDAIEQMAKLKEKELVKQKQQEFIKKISPSKDVIEKMKQQNSKMHNVHPPSILSYFKPIDKHSDQYYLEYQQQEKLLQHMKPQIDNFKLKMKDERDQEKFLKFYSGGPSQNINFNAKDKYENLYQQHIDKIIKIQKLIRKKRILNVIKNIKEQEFHKKVEEHEQKLYEFLGKYSPYQKTMRIIYTSLKIKEQQKKKQDEKLNKQFVLNLSIQKSRSISESDSVTSPKSRFNIQNTIEKEQQLKRISNALTIYTNDTDDIKQSNSQIEENNSNCNLAKQITSKKPKLFVPKPHSNLAQMKLQLQQNRYEKSKKKEDSLNETVSTRRNTLFSKESSQINPNTQSPRLIKTFSGVVKQDFLLKQQKLIQSAKSNFFIAIKNCGFIFSPSDTMIKDEEGNSPLYYAVLNQNEEFVNWLLKKGASPNQICSQGNTPVHIAFNHKNFQIIQSLLNYGADINKVNIQGFTPIANCPQYMIDKLDLSKCVVYSSKQKFERNITNFDNSQYFYHNQQQEFQIERLQLENFYPLDQSVNRTILLKENKSE
ncbi:ankyrin domain protein (macronuclear) [Tetrahymena thermophila SB210]|uniref:Ankyrin domain protein n=1 Tax=Tetrahymena thermophila (strain SB210) TaxID=312017 RepID=I7MFZ6_TETTS|nr:ankyrin domain protein [Tetrahymena thermophila SB210]EAS00828.2 ankyrin domain protein [Tetrahymena thermophila SB210]|eukprot:XP_001021073.2 ankyrin domain protein [Tetrahymena thermophila SB210]